MEFGKIKDLQSIDFGFLPGKDADLPGKPSTAPLRVFTGCPVWANKAWVGHLYPKGTAEKDFLKHYARRFNTIELNATHYKIPDTKTVERWKNAVGGGFLFCPKIPQDISHRRIFTADFREITHFFCEQIQLFEAHLGPCLLQMPPWFEPGHSTLLRRFLDFFPAHLRLAVELRHPACFKPDALELLRELLAEYGCTFNLTDTAGRRDAVHMRFSDTCLFLRFVGNDLHPTDFSRVDSYMEHIGVWQQKGLQEVYFFAHEPDNVKAPELAVYFLEQMNKKCGAGLFVPLMHRTANAPQQQQLF